MGSGLKDVAKDGAGKTGLMGETIYTKMDEFGESTAGCITRTHHILRDWGFLTDSA